MPQDSTPRSLLFLILKSPGSTAPIMATTILSPSLKFWAPQTICRGAGLPSASVFWSPTETLQSHMWSESGCGCLETTWPMTTWSRCSPTFSIVSTSVPVRMSSRYRTFGSSGRSTIEPSHSYEMRMSMPFCARSFLLAFPVPRTAGGPAWHVLSGVAMTQQRRLTPAECAGSGPPAARRPRRRSASRKGKPRSAGLVFNLRGKTARQ